MAPEYGYPTNNEAGIEPGHFPADPVDPEDRMMAAKHGTLTAEENVTHFARQIYPLADNKELRQRLGKDGRIYARQWTAKGPARMRPVSYKNLLADNRR
ncbi:MAG TPA: hypothetical protein DEP36_13665 [Gammaproteobacteria bacterium]|nr:hypothetical protein [Gammaproteobacteria bacterium]